LSVGNMIKPEDTNLDGMGIEGVVTLDLVQTLLVWPLLALVLVVQASEVHDYSAVEDLEEVVRFFILNHPDLSGIGWRGAEEAEGAYLGR